MDKIPRSFGTHNGTFHADEVTACALLLLFDMIDYNKILRTRDPKLLASCEYICDVGGVYNPEKKLFDHHQADYKGPLSSAGMILKFLYEAGKMNEQEYDFFNDSVILGVDAHDNGKDPQLAGFCTYSHIIANYTPISYDSDSAVQDKAFYKALDFAFDHLQRLYQRNQYVHSCRQIVADAMESKEAALQFNQSIPWLETFFEMGGEYHPAKFVIMPSGKHWKLRGIPPSTREKMKVRIPLPKKWAGLIGDDLKKVSEIPGAIFCHKELFISVWETKEDAIQALNKVLNFQNE